MNPKPLLYFLFLWMLGPCSFASTEHVTWDKTPIHINLPLHEERLVKFPSAISIVDSELESKVHVLKIQDALYFKADEPFANKRLIVQLMPDGEAIILNFTASADIKETNTLEVVLEKPDVTQETQSASTSNLNPVVLTRFAIQSLYAPERLVITPNGVSRTPMQTHKNITFVYGASVIAKPLISWHGDGLYVTAVELKNNLNKPVILDPRQLLGHWQTAAFYPTNLLNPRTHKSTTTAFVTSVRPFGEALSEQEGFVR